MNLSTIRWRAFFGVAALSCLSVLGANAQRTVTLRLNSATLPDTTKTNEPFEIRGCLAGCTGDQSALPGGQVIAWNSNTTLKPVNRGGDYWELTFQIPDNVGLNYKFYSPHAEAIGIGGWEDGSDHTIAAGTGNVNLTLPPFGHFFEKGSDKAYDWRPFASKQPDSVSVWFRVYMSTTEAQNDGFDPEANYVVGVRGDAIAGGPLDWGSTKVTLTRESGDNSKPGFFMYSGVARYAASAVGTSQPYKFVFERTSTQYEDGNLTSDRRFTVPRNDTTLMWKFYGDAKAVRIGRFSTAAVNFQADLTPLEQLGIFDRASGDSIEVRGAFNGWDCGGEGAPDDCLMRKRPFGSVYDLGYTFVNTAEGSSQEYKYYVNFRDDVFRQRFGRTPPSGWEENINNTGINRNFTFTGQPVTLPLQFFQGITTANVIPNGTTVNTTFRVDMRPALTFQNQPFVPATDSVFILFGDPFWLFTQGDQLSATGDPIHLTKYTLTDPDGDRIYTGTFPVRGATINGIPLSTYSGMQYQYQFGNATKGYYTEAGTGTSAIGRRRTRFIVPTGPGAWPSTYNVTTQPEVIRPTGALPYECNPGLPANDPQRPAGCVASGQGTTAVEQVDAAASAVSVNAYPNPASGATRFRFDVPQTGHVSLKVYDTMGRMVAAVVDGVQATGTYTTTFDTADLAAGVYVYRLTVGGASVSRTLVVAK